jgi:hypothetical protein
VAVTIVAVLVFRGNRSRADGRSIDEGVLWDNDCALRFAGSSVSGQRLVPTDAEETASPKKASTKGPKFNDAFDALTDDAGSVRSFSTYHSDAPPMSSNSNFSASGRDAESLRPPEINAADDDAGSIGGIVSLPEEHHLDARRSGAGQSVIVPKRFITAHTASNSQETAVTDDVNHVSGSSSAKSALSSPSGAASPNKRSETAAPSASTVPRQASLSTLAGGDGGCRLSSSPSSTPSPSSVPPSLPATPQDAEVAAFVHNECSLAQVRALLLPV